MNNVMLDLETLGNRSDAAIIQAAMVEFDPKTGEAGKGITVNFDFDDAVKHGSVSGSTVKWWMEQSDEARKSVTNDTETYTYFDGLLILAGWLASRDVRHVWSHATFDAPILMNAWKKMDVHVPVSHRVFKDIRTLTALNNLSRKDAMALASRDGIQHNALGDCLYQIEYVSKLLVRLDEAMKASERLKENVDATK